MSENISLNSEYNAVPSTGLKMNIIQRVFGVIFSPGKVMQSLAQKPRILFALLLIMVAPMVKILSIYPMYKEFWRNYLEAYANSNVEVAAAQMEQAVNVTAITGIISEAIMPVVIWLLMALIFLGMIKIFKGEGRYKQILSVTGYASAVITALYSIVVIIFTRLTGVYSDVSITSLAAFLPDMKGSFIFGAARSIEVFSIWQYIVMAVGLTAVSKLDKKKVYIIVGCIFALLLIYLGITEMSAAAALAKG